MGTRATLVTTNWVLSQLKNAGSFSGAGVRILDASWVPVKGKTGYEDFYQKGHIPNALHFDHSRCVSGLPFIPWNLPDTNCFTDYVQTLGIGKKTHIITYDSLNTRAAGRAWWIFRLFGHNNISILDGGMNKWIQDGFEVTTDDPIEVEKSDFEAHLDKNLVWNFEDMKSNFESNTAQVLDSRPPSEFFGDVESESGLRLGHIPGSKNVPFVDLFTKEGTFKSKEELTQLFESNGVDLDRPMVSMCLIGLRACSVAAAAKIVTGKDSVPVYYGSWKEWSNLADDEMCTVKS